MADENKNKKSRKETYREKIGQFRDFISNPYNWFVRFLPAMCVLVCAVVIGRLWWYNLANPNRCLEIVDLFREGIGTSIWTNIILILGVIYASITLFLSVLLRPQWWHLPIYIITITYICVLPQWEPLQTVIPNWSYPRLLKYVLIIIALAELCVLLIDKYTKENLKDLSMGEQGFATKTNQTEMVETGWDMYIETIFELVGQNQLAEESFAIGIAGKWGSGKTTFYEAIKRKINNDKQFLLCEFKPWQILESERITPEFFAEFAKVLSEGSEDQDKLLRDNIIKYAQLLTAVSEVSGVVNLFSSVIGSDEEKSIQSLRNKIDEQLQNSKTNVAVLIDDLDRLNKEELLEIMRLVRASANFKHVLFILTYDRKYFADILDNEQGIEYLKKIVNVEICLPTIEQYKYGKLLEQSLCAIFNEDITDDLEIKRDIRKIISSLKNIIRDENSKAEHSLLYQNLHNFRDIKRFSNQLGLILRHLVRLNALKDYHFPDLFWIEVLHYTEEGIYNELQMNYSSHLAIKRKEDNNQNDKQESLIPISGSSNPLLKYIFIDNNVNHPINSIIWTNHYYSYFAHRRLDNYISSTEFKLLMNSTDKKNALGTINKWLLNERTSDCLIHLIEAFPHNFKFETTTEADNYTYILLDMLLKISYSQRIDYKKSLPVILFKKKYHQSYFSRLNKYSPYVIISKQIRTHPDICWNSVLTAMCLTLDEELKTEEFDSPIMEELYYVIPKKELSDLAELNYIMSFEGHDMPIEKLFKKGDDYTDFILSSSYVTETTGYKTVIKHYSNLIGNHLIKRYDETIKDNLSDKEFDVIYTNLQELSGIHYHMDEETAHKKILDTIHKILGSTENFEHLLNEHFDLGYENIKICRALGVKIKVDKPDISYALKA